MIENWHLVHDVKIQNARKFIEIQLGYIHVI